MTVRTLGLERAKLVSSASVLCFTALMLSGCLGGGSGGSGAPPTTTSTDPSVNPQISDTPETPPDDSTPPEDEPNDEPVDDEPANDEPGDDEPADEEPVDEEPPTTEPPDTQPPETPPTVHPSSAELSRNYGITAINGETAYVVGATGKGVTVALIDSGIDRNNVEFAGRIHEASIDVISDTVSGLQDDNGHGTHIAGIVGAAANDRGTVGVAPETTLLALKANDPGADPGELLFFDDDVAEAINRAIDEGANIINLSFGKLSSISDEYQEALARAVAQDILVVAAAGNEPSGETTIPASLAGSAEAKGRILAVGAVDEDNQIAEFSSQPGFDELQSSFLVAPGVNIRSTSVGGGLETRSGTSFATPHVSGAAAVLRSAFPSLTMEEIAQILLTTATDLGSPGNDPAYGVGIVNLDAALAPVGSLALASTDNTGGSSELLHETQLSLGAAFGDALSDSASLASVMALDDYDRPYRADIRGHVARPETSFGLDDLISPDSSRHASALPGQFAGSSAGLAWSSDDKRLWQRGSTGLDSTRSQDAAIDRFDLTGSAGQQSWNLGYGINASSIVTSAPADRDHAGLFWQGSYLTAPEMSLVGNGYGGSVRHRLGDSTNLVAGFVQSDETLDSDPDADQTDARVFHMGLDHQATEQLQLSLGYSRIDEDEAFLGTSGSGAFGEDASASTNMITLRGDLDVGAGFSLFASGSLAQTEVGGDQGMLQDWNTVQSEAFAVGITRNRVFGEHDRMGFMVGQPLRVADAEATLDTPAARDMDGNVVRSQERVDMAPDGREINFQLSYHTPLSKRFTLGSWFMFRHEPGHDAEADDDYAAGLRVNRKF